MPEEKRGEGRNRIQQAALLLLVALGLTLGGADGSAPGVVLLTDGRLLTGIVSEVSGGYRVETGGRFIVVPFTEVRLTAETAHAAYEKMRDARKTPKVDDHLQLSEWCWKNNLPGEAHTEVVAALKLDPLRSESRALFQKIEAHLFPGQAAATVVKAEANSQPEALTRSGLTRSTMEEYVSRVQPLLMNKCGNVSCHGQNSSGALKFVNTRAGAGNHRAATEANLDTLFRFVNFENPAASPVLARPADNTGLHKGLFTTDQDRDRWKVVENLVQLIARERAAPANSLVRRELSPTAPPILQPPPRVEGRLETPGAILPAAATEKMSPRAEAPVVDHFLEQIRLDLRPDAFDPEVFNRRVHGRSSRSGR